MKVLETLGRHHSGKSAFSYQRTSEGVAIRAISQVDALGTDYFDITSDEWNSIISRIESQSTESFGLHTSGGSGNPSQSLKSIIKAAVPQLASGKTWNDSWLSYVYAILEHEGTMDIYTGALGPGHQAKIILARTSKAV